MNEALRSRETAAGLACVAVLVVLPALLSDFSLSIMGLVFLTATVGIAWNLMLGYTGLLSLGHALYFGIGAYVMALAIERYGVSPWLAMVPAALLPAVAGLLVGAICFRFSVGGVYFALVTIAFAEMARITFEHWSYVGDTAGLFLQALTPNNVPLRSLRGSARFFYYALLTLTIAAWLLSAVLVRSRIGYFWRAIREDEEASRAMGVQTVRYKLLAVVVSAGITGVAGAWFTLINGSLFPDSVLGMRVSIDLIVAPIVGGLGTLGGPLLGALLIVPINEFSRTVAQSFGVNGLNFLVYGLILMVVITVAPHGCWPVIARWLKLDSGQTRARQP